MSNSTAPTTTTPEQDNGRLPSAALLIMALMGFVLIASETMPAGLLPHIAAGINISEADSGPARQRVRPGHCDRGHSGHRLDAGTSAQTLAVFAMLGILAANVVTAVSPDIMLSLGVRLFAGVYSGLLWESLRAMPGG